MEPAPRSVPSGRRSPGARRDPPPHRGRRRPVVTPWDHPIAMLATTRRRRQRLGFSMLSGVSGEGDDMRLGWLAWLRRATRGRGIVAVAAVVVMAGGCFLGADPVQYAGFGGPLDLADLNGDGHPDIVSCSGQLLNDGTGAFPTSSPGVAPACGIDAATGDVDGDGHVDRVVLHENPAPTGHYLISLFPGDGTGGFGPEAWVSGDIPSAAAIALGDVNGDHRTDIVIAAPGEGDSVHPTERYQVMLAVDGPERFAAPVSYPDGIGDQPFFPLSLVLRDLDGDGDLDLVTVSYSANTPESGWLGISLNDGTGAFPAGTGYLVTPPGGRFTSAAVGGPAILDVDGNGTLDVVVTTQHVDPNGVQTICLAALLGDGNGGFQPPECLPAPSGSYGLLGEDQN